MASVLLCNMHNKVFDAFCRLYKHLGIQVYCPKFGEPNYFNYNGNSRAPKSVNDYAIELRREELSGTDISFVQCSCWEQIQASQQLSKELNVPLVLRAGNNNVPYNSSHSDFLITNDIQTYNKNNGIQNKLFFYLPPDYDVLTPITEYQQASRIVPAFVHYYETYWKGSYAIFEDIRKATREFAFLEFGSSSEDVKARKYIPELARYADVTNVMRISRAMLHIKEMEGYGWSVLEAVALGLPVIAHKPFVTGKTCEHFLVDGVTCRYMNQHTHHADFMNDINNVEVLADINKKAPSFIREKVNMEREGEKMRKFLEKVIK